MQKELCSIGEMIVHQIDGHSTLVICNVKMQLSSLAKDVPVGSYRISRSVWDIN